MGMFDYVRCRYPLPDPEMQDTVFQTKDTPDQFMTEYVIEEDGRLTWQPYHYESVPREERPYPDGEGLKGLYGSMKRVDDGDRATVPYHGDIRFYDCKRVDGDLVIHEYIARFTEGVCVRIWRTE